jgi:hypothetical protein
LSCCGLACSVCGACDCGACGGKANCNCGCPCGPAAAAPAAPAPVAAAPANVGRSYRTYSYQPAPTYYRWSTPSYNRTPTGGFRDAGWKARGGN